MVLRRILLSASVCALFFSNAHAINLGGTEVSKDKFIVYLLIGHSQMAGIITNNNDNVTDPHAWVYRWQSTKTWELAKETGSLKNGLSGRGTGGPGMPFLKTMISSHSGYYFGVVTNADPSATCHGLNTGNNGSTLSDSANRYWRDAQLFREIVTAGRAIKNDVTLGGVLFMLGTVEATRADSIDVCQEFSKDIAQMAKDMRDSLGMPNLPFVVADYEKGATNTFSVTNLWPGIIAKQLDSVPRKLSNSVLINSAAIPMYDDHHFTIAGEGEWAHRAADSLDSKHFFPPSVGTLEKPVMAQSQRGGTIAAAQYGSDVKIDYRSVSDGRPVLKIFNLEGKQLTRQLMTGAAGVFSAVWNTRTAAAHGVGGCFIITIEEKSCQSTTKFHSIQ